MAVTVLAAYDVRHDGSRTQLAHELQAYGDRIQKSVFMLMLDADADDELAHLQQTAATRIDPQTDSVCLIRLCPGCVQGIVRIGQVPAAAGASWWIIV